jgi:hypothetical protein
MIGIEGMVGISALLGGESSAQQVIMQIAGTTLRMEDAGAKPLLTDRGRSRSRATRRRRSRMNWPE